MLQRYLNRIEALREDRKKDSGFTLTELLIVIVILGVLAGIVVFAVANLTGDSRVVACKTDKRTIQAAAAAYRAAAGHAPGSVADLVTGYDPDGSGPSTPESFLGNDPTNPDYSFTIAEEANGNIVVTAVNGDADLLTKCNAAGNAAS